MHQQLIDVDKNTACIAPIGGRMETKKGYWVAIYQKDETRLKYIHRKTGLSLSTEEIEIRHQQFLNQYVLPLAKDFTTDPSTTVRGFIAKMRWRLMLSEFKGSVARSDNMAIRDMVNDNDDNVLCRQKRCLINHRLKKMAASYHGQLAVEPDELHQYLYMLIGYEAAYWCMLFNIHIHIQLIPTIQIGIKVADIEKQAYITTIAGLISKHRSERRNPSQQINQQHSKKPHHHNATRPKKSYALIEEFLDYLRKKNPALYGRCRLAFLYKLLRLKKLQQQTELPLLNNIACRFPFMREYLGSLPIQDIELSQALDSFVKDSNHHDEGRGLRGRPFSCWGETFALALSESLEGFIGSYRKTIICDTQKTTEICDAVIDFCHHWFNQHHDFRMAMARTDFFDKLYIYLDDLSMIVELFDTDHEFAVLVRHTLENNYDH